jgi:DNA-binding NtrC family response regulator
MAARQKRKLLLVDDDPEFLGDSEVRLSSTFRCVTTADFGEAVALCQKEDPDAVLLDLVHQKSGERRGFETLTAIRGACPFVPVIMWTEDDGLASRLEAQKRGAFWYVTKSAGAGDIGIVLEAALEERRVRIEGRAALDDVDEGWGAFVCASAVMRDLLARVDRIAATERVILITGERGVGKGLLAREIHRRSRRAGPFIGVDCPALSPTLFGSDLFGHLKGAYTSADADRVGLCEKAGRGTLFLDEVGDMPRETQVQLRLLVDERVYRRVGADRNRVLEARIIAATNMDLDALAAGGQFKSDLLDRLAEERIHIPPLRERPEDIPALARHFVAVCGKEAKRPLDIASDALFVLSQRKWDGNVRQLRHVVEGACVAADGAVVTATHLAAPARGADDMPADYHVAKEQNELEFKRRFLVAALSRNSWDVRRAADETGLPPQTIYRMMKEAGVERPGK